MLNFSDICKKTILTVTEPCEAKGCKVDKDERTKKRTVKAEKPYTHACVGIIRDDSSVHAEDLFRVHVSELSSNTFNLKFKDVDRVRIIKIFLEKI
jgi:hypothetical protein